MLAAPASSFGASSSLSATFFNMNPKCVIDTLWFSFRLFAIFSMTSLLLFSLSSVWRIWSFCNKTIKYFIFLCFLAKFETTFKFSFEVGPPGPPLYFSHWP